jgi:hypothetical protein
MRFQVNAPSVVAEIIDGELVVMNLETGTYYSSLDYGAEVWRWIEAGYPLEDVVEAAVSHSGAPRSTIVSHIQSFVDHLSKENLIRPESADAAVALPPIERPPVPYRQPQLNVYADMQDLLMLDPIHDVDAVGWPSLPPTDSDKAEAK